MLTELSLHAGWLAQHTQGASRSLALDLLAILAAAGLVSLLLRKVPQALIPGYLIAGALLGPLIGPHGLNLSSGAEANQSIVELATVLLMFTIGLTMVMYARIGRAVALLPVAGLIVWGLAVLADALQIGANLERFVNTEDNRTWLWTRQFEAAIGGAATVGRGDWASAIAQYRMRGSSRA